MVKKLFLGRDIWGLYELGTVKKGWNPHEGFPVSNWVKSFCVAEFEAITGIKLKPGEIRRVKSITIDLEPPS